LGDGVLWHLVQEWAVWLATALRLVLPVAGCDIPLLVTNLQMSEDAVRLGAGASLPIGADCLIGESCWLMPEVAQCPPGTGGVVIVVAVLARPACSTLFHYSVSCRSESSKY